MSLKEPGATIAAASGPTLRAMWDFTGLTANDWKTGGATRSLTPDSGAVESGVSFELNNQSAITTWGPDGTNGIEWTIPTNTGDWPNSSNVPDGFTSYVRVPLTNILDSPGAGTTIYIATKWGGDAPAADYEHRGHGVFDGAGDALVVLDTHDTSRKLESRIYDGAARTGAIVASAITPSWLIQKVYRDGHEVGYGATGDPAWADAVATGGASNLALAPGAALGIDFTADDIILFAGRVSASGSATFYLQELWVWQED